MSRGVLIVTLVCSLFVAGFTSGVTVGSEVSHPACPVCGERVHENVTGSVATLSMTGGGDVHWVVELEVAEPTASAWRDDPGQATAAVDAALADHRPSPLLDPTEPTVEVGDGRVTIEFLDRGPVRERFGLRVLPYFYAGKWKVRADRLVVIAPDGHRIVNHPPHAEVEDNRAVWTSGSVEFGNRPRDPLLEETYVVSGTGPTADARGSLAVVLMPIRPVLYGLYLIGLLLVGTLGYTIARTGDRRLDRRIETVALAIGVVPYLALVLSFHPLPLGGFGAVLTGFVILVGVLGSVTAGTLIALWTTYTTE